ncbi:MAG: SemiSWEET family transporter [bacterium]|nr:SemiSWEET family transporter [bacterium]
MEIINILGTNAIVAGLLGVIVGLVTQIIKNYRRKSTEGLSFWWILLAFYSYVSWLLYGIFKQDFFLTVPQTLGSICMIIILFQFWIYQKR